MSDGVESNLVYASLWTLILVEISLGPNNRTHITYILLQVKRIKWQVGPVAAVQSQHRQLKQSDNEHLALCA